MNTEPDPIASAIAALTTAARRRRTIGASTLDEHTEPVDFGEIACHVITSVAANIGGVGELLSGRPGSWEAEYVRQIVRSTTGDDERELMRHRTEPLRLVVDVEAELSDLGIFELYEEASEELARRVEDARDGLIRKVATPAEQARLADIEAVITEWGLAIQGEARRARAVHLRDEWESIVQSVRGRAEQAGDPLYAALAAAEAADRQLEVLWEQDQAAYREAYAAAVRQRLNEKEISAKVEVVDILAAYLDAARDQSQRQIYFESALVDELNTHARKAAALPMTGQAPDWSDGMPADALRRAGLTYLERATASQ